MSGIRKRMGISDQTMTAEQWDLHLKSNKALINKLIDYLVKSYEGWTPTAIELWNDKKFIEKRIREQMEYESIISWKEDSGEMNIERYREIMPSIIFQYDKFVKRLKELNSSVA